MDATPHITQVLPRGPVVRVPGLHAVREASPRTVCGLPQETPEGMPYWTLSVIFPGWGQLCQYRVGTAMFWIVAVLIGYLFGGLLGIVPHVLCVVEGWAASRKPVLPYGQKRSATPLCPTCRRPL